ncbi:hypothetical protein MT418_008318 [Batrachochytrium dendrobatidis]
MYSKSERKFLQPDKDHANPRLGPGCYAADDTTLIAGKLVGNDGYAPFTSLSPRKSYFDTFIINGPAPGTYDNELGVCATHRKDPASLFGRSRSNRFMQNASPTPGPGAYISLSLQSSSHELNNGSRTRKPNIHKLSLMQQPVGVELSSNDVYNPTCAPKYIKKTSRTEIDQNNSTEAFSQRHVAGTDMDEVADLETETLSGPEAKRVSFSQRTNHSHDEDHHSENHSGNDHCSNKHQGNIVWKRKYVPPSIPAGRYAFGYKENTDGDLMPRKPPKKITEDEPLYLSSFAEKAKHESRGHKFTKGGDRLHYKPTEAPGPNRYNPLMSEKYLNTKSNGSGSAAMTLAPCRRVTDEIVADSVKRGVPGPGAYNIKAPLTEKLAQPKNRIRFGGQKADHTYINQDLIKLPGPGAYYPEYSSQLKPHSHKPQPFGSTSKRFDNLGLLKSSQAPAVGSYEIEKINSIFEKVQKRALDVSLRPAAFGFISERFVEKRQIAIPGPGAYDPLENSNNHSRFANPSLKEHTESRKKHSHIKKIAHPSGMTQVLFGNLQFPASKVHSVIFGTQTERFAESTSDLPPPGAYDVINSFQALKTKGRIENTGVLASQNKRELFPMTSTMPGPGEYNPVLVDHKEIRRHVGAFLSTGSRFAEKHEKVPGPGPGSYPIESKNGLLKKTFNITLTEWGQTVGA